MSEAAPGEPAVLSPELRDRLLYYAWRAPSPHNAQGWRVEADGPVFRVSRDPARQVLRELDPEGREGDLACGAVVANLCVAARASGFEAEVRWRPDGKTVAEVTLRPVPERPGEEARARLGAAFDIRDFHSAVLDHGSLPLPVLGQVVADWAASATAATT